MREMLTNAMHVSLALVSVRQNEVVKQLAGWGAILAVPTVIFSLYGLNFEGMPELKTASGYPVTLFVTVAGCVALRCIGSSSERAGSERRRSGPRRANCDHALERHIRKGDGPQVARTSASRIIE